MPSKKFSLARDGCLDQTTEEVADITNHDQDDAAGHDHDQDARVAFSISSRGIGQNTKQAASDDREEEDSKQHGDKPDIHAHVAVENMAEFMRDHSLEFVAVKFFECSAGHGYHRVAGRESGGKSIEPGLVVEHVDGWHRDARGDGHFFDDVQQAFFL